MKYETILFQKEERVAEIVMNRPEKMNAVSMLMVKEMLDAFDDVAADNTIGVVVLKGAGEKAFTSGDDTGPVDRELWWNWTPGEMYVGLRRKHFFHLIEVIRDLRKPVIAAVHGWCLGSGPELALACDIVIASETTKFGIYRGTSLLPRVVGYHKACELVFTGDQDFISAEEAAAIRMVNRVVPRDKLESTVKELAQKLARQPTPIIGWTKWALNKTMGSYSVENGLDFKVLAEGLNHASKYISRPTQRSEK